MKKNKKNTKQRKSALKRSSKRGVRLKSTQKNKSKRKAILSELKSHAREKFEQQMKDLFGDK